MKCCFVLLFLQLINTIFCSETIVIKTDGRNKVYNFFPLNCNYMEFLGMASNDIYVALTQSPTYQSPSYEIVIGGWDNTKSVVCKDDHDHPVATSNQSIDKGFAKYWFSVNPTTKTIQIGFADEKPFLTFVDEHFYQMSYFGLTTGYGAEGTFQLKLKDLTCSNLATQ